MSLSDSVQAFIEGIKSVIDVSGVIQGTVSGAISNGIEGAFKRIRKPLEQSLMRISVILMSLFFIIWGIALLLDNFVPYRGLGFVLVGAFFGIIVVIFVQDKTD
ncbi:MAG: hypothetical protein Q7S22_08355 [Candidatus Micrarchaeota archaeon]|nr:hypothetical protein [Candidatus Micrarchaeota archaeon]